MDRAHCTLQYAHHSVVSRNLFLLFLCSFYCAYLFCLGIYCVKPEQNLRVDINKVVLISYPMNIFIELTKPIIRIRKKRRFFFPWIFIFRNFILLHKKEMATCERHRISNWRNTYAQTNLAMKHFNQRRQFISILFGILLCLCYHPMVICIYQRRQQQHSNQINRTTPSERERPRENERDRERTRKNEKERERSREKNTTKM